jgi:hypothetical protein
MKENILETLMPSDLKWERLDEARVGGIEGDITRDEAQAVPTPLEELLCARLLRIGGEKVFLEDDPLLDDYQELILDGVIMPTENVRMSPDAKPPVDGDNSYENCCRLWKRSNGTLQIAKGFALSDELVWHDHFWLLSKDGEIIETEEKHKKYFGVVWDAERAEFHAEDIPAADQGEAAAN